MKEERSIIKRTTVHLNASRIEIPIVWREGVVKVIKIRHLPAAMAINIRGESLKSISQPGHKARFALNVRVARYFSPKPGRRMV